MGVGNYCLVFLDCRVVSCFRFLGWAPGFLYIQGCFSPLGSLEYDRKLINDRPRKNMREFKFLGPWSSPEHNWIRDDMSLVRVLRRSSF